MPARFGIIRFIRSLAPSSNPTDGFLLYSDDAAGQPKVRQADGTIFALAPSTEIDSVIFDGGDPTTDHTLGDSIIFDAGGPT